MRMYERPVDGDLEEIKIELTNNCPLSCIHCSSNASPDTSLQITREAVFSLIKQARKLHVKSIIFSGGEPLQWPWLLDVIKECNTHGLRASIYSTGINVFNEGSKSISELAEIGLKKVIFSLHSPTRDQHERITRKLGSFDETLKAMRELRNNHIEREIHFVPFKLNFRHLPDLMELAKELAIPRVSLLRFVPQGRGVILKKSHEMLMHKETLELRKSILDCREKSDVDIRLGSPYNILLLNETIDCIAARKTLCVGPNGNVYPCDAFKNIEPEEIGLKDSFNSIFEHTLQECWEKSEYLNTIRRYLATPFEEPCSSCPQLEKCKSGCLAQKVIEQESIENGNIIKRPDPLCLRTFIGG
jgi:radical SAM protein with 4Fe4S-binding SPASM domain